MKNFAKPILPDKNACACGKKAAGRCVECGLPLCKTCDSCYLNDGRLCRDEEACEKRKAVRR